MVDKSKLSKEEQATWDGIASKDFIFPDKDATLRITPHCEIGALYLEIKTGNLFVWNGYTWQKMK